VPNEADSNPTTTILEDEYLVDNLFPTRRIHIICGPVGSGKTTLEFQLAQAVLDKASFLGEPTHNVEGVVFLSADRSRRETHATLRRMGMLSLIPKIKWVFTQERTNPVPSNLEMLIDWNTRPGQMLIVEPLAYFIQDGNGKSGDPNNYGHVSHFLEKIKGAVEKRDITLVSSLHPPKAKKGEGYQATREKLLGSTAWAGWTDTMMFIEPEKPEDPDDPYRKLFVLPRNTRSRVLDYMQEPEHGLLAPTNVKSIIHKSTLDKALEAWEQETWTRGDANDWAIAAGLSPETAKKWLQQMDTDKRIKRVERGVYKRVDPS